MVDCLARGNLQEEVPISGPSIPSNRACKFPTQQDQQISYPPSQAKKKRSAEEALYNESEEPHQRDGKKRKTIPEYDEDFSYSSDSGVDTSSLCSEKTDEDNMTKGKGFGILGRGKNNALAGILLFLSPS